MALAYDASSEATGTTTFSWTHTPVGTPAGVFVFVVVNTISTDVISGVTYGGVAMARQQFAVDTSGEIGSCYGYFLGTGLPTGAQTIQVTVGSGTESKWACGVTVTAATNTRVVGSGKVEGDTANPSVTITGIAGASYSAAGLFCGQNTPTSVTAGAGQTIRQDEDIGNQSASCESATSEQASGDQVVAFTMAIEDVAMVAIAIEEGSSTAIKTFNGNTYANTKTVNGLALASVKTWNGLA